MEFWKDAKEPIDAFLKMFEKCMKDPELSAGLKKVNQVILFDYTQDGPDCSFWIDTRGGKLTAGAGKARGQAGPRDEPVGRRRAPLLVQQAQPGHGHHPGQDQGQGIGHGAVEAGPEAQEGRRTL